MNLPGVLMAWPGDGSCSLEEGERWLMVAAGEGMGWLEGDGVNILCVGMCGSYGCYILMWAASMIRNNAHQSI